MESEVINIKKKKWYKKKKFYIIGGVVLIIGLIVFGQLKNKNKGPQYETVKVERGNLTQTVDATGNVESANELDLRFETGGKIARIYKNVNDPVKAGETIMSLDLSELGARVSQSQAGVNRAQSNLDKLMAGETEQYLSSLKSKLDQSLANYEQVKVQYENSISDAEAVIATAKINLELSNGDNSQIVTDAYTDAVALLNTVQYVLGTGLTEADNILGLDNTLANDDFEDVLSALNSSKLNQANSSYYLARNKKNITDQAINNITTNSSHLEIDNAILVSKEALSSMKNLLYSVSEVLDNTLPIGELTQSSLNTLKTSIQTVRGSVATQYTNLINQEQLISAAKNSFDTYQIAYDKAVANLNNLKSKQTADLAAAKSLVDQAEASYNDAKNPPRVEDVSNYRASLQEAQAGLAQAVANLNKAIVKAPVEGVVGKIDGKVGQYVTYQDNVAKLVSPHFEIKVDIPETDIIKIALNNTATIKFDAYGDEVKFNGVVTEIEKGETVIQDVIYYNVTVSLEDTSEKEILNGMTADVIFYTAQKDNTLYIPLRTILTHDDGTKYVRVLENNQVKETDVSTGLRGDNGLVEVTSGLNEGQEIVLSTNK